MILYLLLSDIGDRLHHIINCSYHFNNVNSHPIDFLSKVFNYSVCCKMYMQETKSVNHKSYNSY